MVANWIQGSWVARPKPLDSPHTATRPRSLQRARPAACGGQLPTGSLHNQPLASQKPLQTAVFDVRSPFMSHGSLDGQPLGLRGPNEAGGSFWTGKGRNCSLATGKCLSDLDVFRSSEESMAATPHSFILTVKKVLLHPSAPPWIPPCITTFSERGAFAGCFHLFLYSLL